jgi:hypothetical protein
MNLPDAEHARELSEQTPPKYANKAFEIILDSVALKISKAIRNHMRSIVFQVPSFVFGCPMYETVDAVEYIETALRHKRYEVTSWPSGAMAIMWSSREPSGGAGVKAPAPRSKFDITV